MRKRFWTTRKNKYKNKTRKHKKTHYKRKKQITMKGGSLPFSEFGSLSSILSSFKSPLNTNITAAGNVSSSPYVWSQRGQVPGSYGI
jgi:hypothetical protein